MARVVVRVLAAVAVLACTGSAWAQEIDVTGTYRCEGMSPSGKPYRTVVEIAKDEQTYMVRWRNQEGPSIGIGIRRDGVLAVSYFTGRAMGVVVYRIEKGPKLTGQWGILGADGQLYPETLTREGLDAHNGEHREPSSVAAAPVNADAFPD